MAVAGEIASGRVVLDGDGCLPLETLVALHARRTASTRRVIALLQCWQWVRRVAVDRWVAGDGGADPHREARAAFPADGRCAACTHDLAGAYTVAAGGQLVLCASCAEPVRSGVALEDLAAVVAALLGARSADKASRFANRLRERFPDLPWEEVRRREPGERVRIEAWRAEARQGLRYAEMGWREAERLAVGDVPDAAHTPRRPAARSPSKGHSCRVCGRTRANEQFSGKGHARHVCKDCERTQRQPRSGKSRDGRFNSVVEGAVGDQAAREVGTSPDE
jgi:hypothetical protein